MSEFVAKTNVTVRSSAPVEARDWMAVRSRGGEEARKGGESGRTGTSSNENGQPVVEVVT